MYNENVCIRKCTHNNSKSTPVGGIFEARQTPFKLALAASFLLLLLALVLGCPSPSFATHVGGGFTAGGIQGQYYNNTTMSGSPSFTRQDTRIDFNWSSTAAPGGSPAPGFNAIGTTNYSVLWTGQLIPRFTETYTFKTISASGVQLFIKPHTSGTYTTLINDWTSHSTTTDTATYNLTAGTLYDIQMEYWQGTGSAAAELHWLSPSTPEEAIEALDGLCINMANYEADMWANAWENSGDAWTCAVDTNGWPTADGQLYVWQGISGNDGTYLLQFSGKANVNDQFHYGNFYVGSTEYGQSLPSGAGYNAATNLTTATEVVTDTGGENMVYQFTNTQRTNTSATNTGVTNITLMRPVSEGSTTYYPQGTLFCAPVETAFSRFSAIRWLTANFNVETNWSDRCPPSYACIVKGGISGGPPWEHEILLSNETGKDLHITIPEMATGTLPTDTTSYVYQLAELIKNGDTVNGVHYPGLNPNLKVYVEYTNEVWNYGFPAWQENYTATQNDISSQDANGAMITFDGNLDPNIDWMRRQALRIKQTSDIFRSVFGNAYMPSTSFDPEIRPLLEWQYDNAGFPATADTELSFLDNYFNNADGVSHVSTPEPISYYLWGGGGATYYDASNDLGLDSVTVTNDSFENGTTGWSFTGDAGVVANGSSLGNPNAPDGTNAAYIEDTGSVSQSINFPAAGVYAFQFDFAGPSTNANTITISLDGANIVPNQGSYLAPGSSLYPSSSYNDMGTFEFTISSAGNHTLKFAGTGITGQYAFIDLIQAADTNALFAGQIPATSDNNNSTVSTADYATRTDVETDWAKRFNLNMVGYEGGWGLGGDGGGSPLQNDAKYNDTRAKTAQINAINIFTQSGAYLNGFGTYSSWLTTANASSYPLVQAFDQENQQLPAEANNGTTIPATLTPGSLTLDQNDSAGSLAGDTAGNSAWIAWNIIVPASGNYTIAATTTSGGSAVLLSDDATVVASGATGGTLSGTAFLIKGLHVVTVRNTGATGFSVSYVTVSNGTLPPPGTPTGLTATAGNTQVLLVWNTASQATSYNVTRGTTAGGESVTPIVTGVVSTSYVNSGLTNGVTYFYTVSAVNGGGTSSASNEASATPAAAGTPVIQINTGGPAVSPFVADTDFSGGGTATNWTGAIDTTAVLSPAPQAVYQSERSGAMTYTISGLTANAAYTVRLHFCENYFATSGSRVFDVSINSSQVLTNFDIYATVGSAHKANIQQFSAAANGSGQIIVVFTNVTNNALINGLEVISTSGGSAPAAPTGLSAAAGNTQVVLSWNSSSGATSYNVYRGTTSGGESGTAIVTGVTVTNYANTGLTNGTTYYFTVKSVNSSGTSGASNEASATPTASTGSIISLDFVGSDTSMGSSESAGVVAATNWNNGAGDTGSGLTLNYSTGTSSGATAAWSSADDWSTPITDSPGNMRMMKGYLDDGTAGNNTVTISSLPSAITSSGYDVYVYCDSDNGATLITGGYTIGSTTIDATDSPNTNFSGTFTQASNSAGNYVKFSSLSAASFTLTASPVAGNRAPINGIQIVGHGGGGAPSAPTGLTATPGNAQVALSWTASSGATSYNVLRSTVSGSGYTQVVNVATTSYTNTSLTNGTTYYYVVAAVNTGGTSANSGQASATPVAPPAAPTGLTAAAGNTQVTLAWTASSGATSYNVYRGTTSGGESGTAIKTGVTTAGYTDTGLTNGTTYYYKVIAVNAGGTSGMSNEASTTPAGSGILLASEPFTETTGALNGANGGTGWSEAWIEQNSHTVVPGYNIINTSPLTYSGLATSGNYAVGGYAYEQSGRGLDLTTGGNFGSNGYLSGGIIGASGKSLWMSLLLREDTSSADGINATLNDSSPPNAWNGNSPLVSVGYFGTASKTGSTEYWSLEIGSTVYKTTVPIAVGTPALFVVEITFGSTNTVNLYLNPTSLGGSAPSSTTLTETTGTSVAFQSFSWDAGSGPGMSSLDELRFGTTYGSVTP